MLPTVRIAIIALLAPAPAIGQALRSDPVDAVVADLEQFIPAHMARANIPGLSIALIRGHRVAWQRGFGVANTLTRTPVDSGTTFLVASLGKPVAAYAGLRLASRGELDLDRSLDSQLTEHWLPDDEARALITPRHLLAHTSGLSNFLGDRRRRSRFTPGTQYAYSGVGFMYLQRILEQKDRSLQSAASREVFAPLGMRGSSFAGDPQVPGTAASGHLRFDRAVAPFAIVFLPLAMVFSIVALVGHRLVRRRWSLPAWAWMSVLAAALTLSVWFIVSRAANPRLVPFFLGAFAALAAGAAVASIGLLALLRRVSGTRPGRPGLVAATAAIGVLIFFGAGTWRIPIPDGSGREGNAASSLRTSAADLARFLLEAEAPTLLSPALARDYGRAQVQVDQQISWGLGIGMQTVPGARAIFSWGRNPSIRAAMVIYPATGDGIVVLANDGQAGDVVESIALRAIGGPRYWGDQ